MEEVFTEPSTVKDLLSKYKILGGKTTKYRNQRDELIDSFVVNINKEREGTKFKPMSHKQIAIKLSHLKDEQDLYTFYKQCLDGRSRYGSFSKVFWGALKVKK